VVGLQCDTEQSLELIARARAAVPNCVILATGHDEDGETAARALRAGVDDVVGANTPRCELEARLAVRVRSRLQAEVSCYLTTVSETARLTRTEQRILAFLVGNKGRIVTRNELSHAIDKTDWIYGDRKFDVHITNIRRKLAVAYGDSFRVQTVRSAGYIFQ